MIVLLLALMTGCVKKSDYWKTVLPIDEAPEMITIEVGPKGLGGGNHRTALSRRIRLAESVLYKRAGIGDGGES